MIPWYAIPSANIDNCRKNIPLWVKQGYNIAILCNQEHEKEFQEFALTLNAPTTIVSESNYQGYPQAANKLFSVLLKNEQVLGPIDVIVTGGDDMTPDPQNHASEIGRQFMDHFSGTLGVMQPTGDRWMMDKSGRAASDRICGSPWLGAEYILRANQGKGPFWPEYYHFFCDEELKEVSEKQGLLWQRRDLTHFHDHWCRNKTGRPEYMHKARNNWDAAAKLFKDRKAAGFPGSELADA